MRSMISSPTEIAKKLLIEHEGFSEFPYRCSAGKLTIGFGRNLEDKGVSYDEAIELLENDILECVHDLIEIFEEWRWNDFSDRRQAALIDMRLNLGPKGFRSFKKMIAAIRAGDWVLAAREALNSRWATQVGRRAAEDANLLGGEKCES